MSSNEPQFDPLLDTVRLWFRAIGRHRFVAAMCFVAVLVATLYVILFGSREYRSTAKLLLRIGHENASLDPTATMTGDTMAPVQTREDEIETALGVMQSRQIIEDVVDDLGQGIVLSGRMPDSEPRESGWIVGMLGSLKGQLAKIDPVSTHERAIRDLTKELTVSAAEKSSVITVEYRTKSPEVAKEVLASWIEHYLEKHAVVNHTQGTYEFFQEQDLRLRQELDQAHRMMRDAKDYGSFVTLQGQQKILETQLENVHADMLRVDAELAEATSRAESIGDLLVSAVETTLTEELSGIANEAHEEMRGLLFQLEVLENDYAAKYKDTHPKLVAIREQLSNARKIVDSQNVDRKQFRELANPLHQQLTEARMLQIATERALHQRKQTLQKQQEELLEKTKELNSHEERLAHLSRDVAILEERYQAHAIRLEQARMDDALHQQQITSVNVIQQPSFEQRPVSPHKPIVAVLGFIAACLSAVSVPVLFEFVSCLFRAEKSDTGELQNSSLENHADRKTEFDEEYVKPIPTAPIPR